MFYDTKTRNERKYIFVTKVVVIQPCNVGKSEFLHRSQNILIMHVNLRNSNELTGIPLYLQDKFKSVKSYKRIRLSLDVTKILSSPGIGSIPLILRPREFLPLVERT